MAEAAAAGLDLANAVREARLAAGVQQVELARRAGITPSYLSRIEGAAWNHGGPWPSDQVLRSLARTLSLSAPELIDMRNRARRTTAGPPRKAPARDWLRGRNAVRYVVSDDGREVYQAAADLITRNPQGGSLRAATVVPDPSPAGNTKGRRLYADALHRKLRDDPDTTYLGVAGAGAGGFEMLRHLSRQQPGDGRDGTDGAPEPAGGLRSRFAIANPLCADVLIGENEAILAIPAGRDRPDLRACVVIDDPDFLRALREWFDEFVWEAPGAWVEIDPDRPDTSFDEIERRLTRPPG